MFYWEASSFMVRYASFTVFSMSVRSATCEGECEYLTGGQIAQTA